MHATVRPAMTMLTMDMSLSCSNIGKYPDSRCFGDDYLTIFNTPSAVMNSLFAIQKKGCIKSIAFDTALIGLSG